MIHFCLYIHSQCARALTHSHSIQHSYKCSFYIFGLCVWVERVCATYSKRAYYREVHIESNTLIAYIFFLVNRYWLSATQSNQRYTHSTLHTLRVYRISNRIKSMYWELSFAIGKLVLLLLLLSLIFLPRFVFSLCARDIALFLDARVLPFSSGSTTYDDGILCVVWLLIATVSSNNKSYMQRTTEQTFWKVVEWVRQSVSKLLSSIQYMPIARK